jgi:hypothetical protein
LATPPDCEMAIKGRGVQVSTSRRAIGESQLVIQKGHGDLTI